MHWYYVVNGQRQGPVSDEEFANLIASGAVSSDTLVWREGMPAWAKYSSVAGAPAQESPGDTEVCAVSGKRYPRREMIQYDGKWISAEHRDTYFQRMREGVAQPGTYQYGGFWIRFCAKFIDGIILTLCGILLNLVVALVMFGTANYFGQALLRHSVHDRLVFQGLTWLIDTAWALAYACFFILRYDAPPGKMSVGLRLMRSDGSSLSVGRIIGRHFAEWLSSLILFIGYLMVIGDPERRALHDRICDTRVVKAR
jgi:uncharacterized RDD family membrane protein YckC